MSKEPILNPYIYAFSTLENVYIYIPFKHSFFQFSKKEWEEIKDFKVDSEKIGKLRKMRIYVEKDYKRKFLEFYQKNYAREAKPAVVYLIATDACNFGCTYCFIENNFDTERRSMANIENAKPWIDYAIRNSGGSVKFIFYGGEPLLNRQFVIEAIEYIKKSAQGKEVSISINTNGSIYSEELAETFRRNNVAVSISLDGPKELHDKNRITKTGTGTFDLIESNMLKYAEKGVNIGLSITITKDTVNFLPQIAEWISDKYKFVKSVGFNPPQSSENGNPANVSNFEFLMVQLYNAFRVFRQKGIYEDRVMRRLKYIITKTPYLKDCAGCGNQIVVAADGRIGPCQAFLGTGKFFERKKPESYVFSDDATIREWNNLTPINKAACQDCPFILICGNGCPYYSYVVTGSLSNCDYRYHDMLPVLIKEISKDLFYKSPKAVFVDYDDTIVLRKSPKELFEEVSREFGIKAEWKHSNLFFDAGEIFRSAGLPDDKLPDATRMYMKLFIESGRLNVGLMEQLKQISAKKYILTNNGKELVEFELKKFGIAKEFDGVFCGGAYKKPQKEYYESVFEETHLRPEDVIYIGDSWADLKPIYDLGVRVVLFTKDSNFGNGFVMSLWKSQKG